MTDAEIKAWTGTGLNPNLDNPVLSSTGIRAGYDALGNEINNASLKTASEKSIAAIEARSAALAAAKDAQIAGLKKQYAEAETIQKDTQGKAYAGRATGLVTSGGGFLGTTQSHQGVLENLAQTHDQEKTALMGKRDAAIQEAQNAFDTKNFALAQEKAKEAKDTEQEIYDRQKEHAADVLRLTQESRAQSTWERTFADDKIKAYSLLSAEEFAKLTPRQLQEADKFFYDGYTLKAREIQEKATKVKTNKEAFDLDKDILDERLKFDLGQKFTLAGQTYTGLKKPDSGGKPTDAETFKSTMNYLRQNLFVKGATIIGSKGIPFLNESGFATPEGWKEAMKISGLKRADFIDEMKGYIPKGEYSKYGLDAGEIKRITGLDPIAGSEE